MTEQEQKREMYRRGCEHLLMEDMCSLHSGSGRSLTGVYIHITMGCDCNCPRMKRYDKRQQKGGKNGK